jgi:signal transduction histidine kinase
MRDELLQGVVESCDRLLDDIKEIIEPLTGVYVPQRAEMDLATTLQKVVMAERHTERSKSHNLVLMGTDEPAPYHGDRRKLMRVFENLISNAVKYSPGHGKTVTIRLQRGPGEYAVSIHDEGLGMTDVQLARVLNKGGRVVEETLGIEGSGFGLSSCQLVLEAHGGRLDARSEPGKGSIFAAILPDSPASV